MKADPSAQQRLLDVQELDSILDTLRHQLKNPPEAAELQALAEQRSEVDGLLGDARVQVDDLTREQRKADADVEQVKARRRRDQQRLDSGEGNAKDLERLQHELGSLDRRISDLEDVELEVMARLENAEKDVAGHQSRLAALDERIEALSAQRDERLTSVRAEGSARTRERAAAAAGLPQELLALYDKLREQKGGVGAAALRARRCGGCSLELNSAELAEVARQPVDAMVRCDECGRILVRTPESGL